jgi:hypothetical protein
MPRVRQAGPRPGRRDLLQQSVPDPGTPAQSPCNGYSRHICRVTITRPAHAVASTTPTRQPGDRSRRRPLVSLRLVPGLIPAGPAARRITPHHQVTRTRYLATCRDSRGAGARRPVHGDQPRAPFVAILALLRIVPPHGSPHPHTSIRTRIRTVESGDRPATQGRLTHARNGQEHPRECLTATRPPA